MSELYLEKVIALKLELTEKFLKILHRKQKLLNERDVSWSTMRWEEANDKEKKSGYRRSTRTLSPLSLFFV